MAQFYNEQGQGVYIVSLTDDATHKLNDPFTPQFDDEVLDYWIKKLPDFTIELLNNQTVRII